MIEEKDLNKVKNLVEILNKASFDGIKMTEVVLVSEGLAWLGKEYMASLQEINENKKIKEDLKKAKAKAEENAKERMEEVNDGDN